MPSSRSSVRLLRLVTSPSALERRHGRLTERLRALRSSPSPSRQRVGGDHLEDTFGVAETAEIDDVLDELGGSELEEFEEQVVDAATAARTADELRAELSVLEDLVQHARKVRFADADRKWAELRDLLQDDAAMRGVDGSRHKIIIFTEHRDTLNYLVAKIGTLLGRAETVAAIHGGVRREDRRAVQDAFRQDTELAVLVATDAAGEGLNLQRAHLMVNYDLPWNPNRIEQRFGRIHRIGQTGPSAWGRLAQALHAPS